MNSADAAFLDALAKFNKGSDISISHRIVLVAYLAYKERGGSFTYWLETSIDRFRQLANKVQLSAARAIAEYGTIENGEHLLVALEALPVNQARYGETVLATIKRVRRNEAYEARRRHKLSDSGRPKTGEIVLRAVQGLLEKAEAGDELARSELERILLLLQAKAKQF